MAEPITCCNLLNANIPIQAGATSVSASQISTIVCQSIALWRTLLRLKYAINCTEKKQTALLTFINSD